MAPHNGRRHPRLYCTTLPLNRDELYGQSGQSHRTSASGYPSPAGRSLTVAARVHVATCHPRHVRQQATFHHPPLPHGRGTGPRCHVPPAPRASASGISSPTAPSRSQHGSAVPCGTRAARVSKRHPITHRSLTVAARVRRAVWDPCRARQQAASHQPPLPHGRGTGPRCRAGTRFVAGPVMAPLSSQTGNSDGPAGS